MEKHIPVLLHECIEGLNIRPDGVYVDATFGRGGHSLEIAKRLDGGRLIAIDQDEKAILAGQVLLEDYKDRVEFHRGNFRELASILKSRGLPGVDGMLFDLGVSSPQLDEAQRGFSYMADAPLDMRMDQRASFSAKELVNTWSFEQIREILQTYGEERYAGRIAKAIVTQREATEIVSTTQLVDIIRGAMPAAALREKQHPAKRSFQAIRIAVNDELGAVEEMLQVAPDCLNPGGRLAVISFHSLEDRLIKRAIQKNANPCTCPRDFPVCICGAKATMKAINRSPIVPGEEELNQNPRARSAKLRIAQRI